jgi:hypothetical protein
VPVDEEPIPDFLRDHLDLSDAAVAEAGLPDDLLAPLSAVGMVVNSWRTRASKHVEDAAPLDIQGPFVETYKRSQSPPRVGDRSPLAESA